MALPTRVKKVKMNTPQQQHPLATEAVRQKARAGRADDDTGRGARAQKADGAGIQMPEILQHQHDLSDHADVKRLHHPAPGQKPHKQHD